MCPYALLTTALKHYGKAHPTVATMRDNLGLAYYGLGQYKKATGYLQQALLNAQKSLHPSHPNVKTLAANLTAAKAKAGAVSHGQ